MKKNKTDKLIQFQSDLETNYKNKDFPNPIDFARMKLELEIENDKNKLLELKALIPEHSNDDEKKINYTSYLVSIITLCFTFFSLILDLNPELIIHTALILLVVLAVVILAIANPFNKYPYKNKWLNYIGVVIDDVYAEFENDKREAKTANGLYKYLEKYKGNEIIINNKYKLRVFDGLSMQAELTFIGNGGKIIKLECREDLKNKKKKIINAYLFSGCKNDYDYSGNICVITGEEPITKIYNEYNGKNHIEDIMDALLAM